MAETSANTRSLSELLTSGLGDRVLIGAVAGLVVARPLVSAADPGRLQLVTPASGVSFNLCIWLILFGFVAWRIVSGKTIQWKGTLPCLALIGVGLVSWFSARQTDVYQRPGEFIAWEWFSLAGLFWVTRQLASEASDRRGFVNVLLASVVSVAAIGIIQRVGPSLGIPRTEPDILDTRPGLVGDDEFQALLNAPILAEGSVHGPLDHPESYLLFLLLGLPLALFFNGTRYRVLLPLVLIAGILALFSGDLFKNQIKASLSEGWKLCQSHPMLGVGPANFSRIASDEVQTSGSAWLTLSATTGAISLVLLLSAIFPLFSRRSVDLDQVEQIRPGTRWDFYLGSIAGLLAGFIWQVGQMPAESPVWEVYKVGGFAISRGIVWLVAFGILEALRPSPALVNQTVRWALTIFLVSGFFTEATLSPVILFTAVLLLAVWMSRTDSVATTPRVERPWMRPIAVFEAVIIACVIGWYIIMVASPAWRTADAIRRARMASRLVPDLARQIDLAKNKVERANARTRVIYFLNGQVVNPLRSASEKDSSNAALLLEIARWERSLWELNLLVDPKEAANQGRDILKLADRAAKLDPRNIAGEQAILEALLLFRKESSVKPKERLLAMNNHLEIVAQRHPELEVPFRYRILITLLAAGDSEGVELEIAKLLRLNRVEGSPHGKLSETQRQEVIDRAKMVIVNPPPELIEEWTR